MVSLKKFVNNFEKLSNKNGFFGLERETILEERIVVYNELDNNLEQYVLEKEKGAGLVSRKEIDKDSIVSKSVNTERVSFRSRRSLNHLSRKYFFRFYLLNGVDTNNNLVNSIDSKKDILSVDMSIFEKDAYCDVTKFDKIRNILNLHYGVYEGNVVSKDIHDKKSLIHGNKSSLDSFIEFNNRRFYSDGNFEFSQGSGFNGDFFNGCFKKKDFYKSLMSEKRVDSNLIFKDIKNRDISKPLQGMYLFFDVLNKIKEKSS